MGDKKNKTEILPKVLLQFEDWTFNLYDVNKVKMVEIYDKGAPLGLKYGIKVFFFTKPTEKVFWYLDKKTRDQRREMLDMMLEDKQRTVIERSDDY